MESHIVWGRDYVPDERDRRFLLPAAITSTKRSRNWKLGPLTDQGSTPHCVGHAWRNWFTSSPIRQSPMSADGIYTLAQYFDEWEGQDYDGTSVRGAAKVMEITGHIKEYRWAFDIESMAQHILEVGPMVVGTNWHDGMMDVDSLGFIHAVGRVLGGHAYLAYGVSLTHERFAICNSWGPWGYQGTGTAFITFADMAALLNADGECCAAVEQTAA